MMRLSEAAAAIGARIEGRDADFQRVSTDTRTLRAGSLFVALRGERYDGHAFLAAAADAGAAGAVVDTAADRSLHTRLPLIVVDDTRVGLGRLAARWRERFTLPVIALTGSSGKTTVKEMLAAILRYVAQQGGARDSADPVLATRGNLNNDIGLPLMLLELAETHRYAVLEMGMNHAGEIRYLASLAKPDVAIVTNAGRAHIEFLGSEEAIARAKGEIFEALGERATAVINADDRFAPLWRELTARARRIEFGLGPSPGVTASYRLHERASDITLKTTAGQASARLAAPGLHNVRNALAAAAAAIALDIPLDVIAGGLERYSGIKGRLQVKSGLNGAVLIDDTYNANPESVRAAIDVLAQTRGRRILVFGDMGELGSDAPRLHAELGVYAKDAGIERMLTLGARSEETTGAFGKGARHYERIEELLSDLRPALASGVTVLVKGSRFMKMERVIETLEVRNEKRNDE